MKDRKSVTMKQIAAEAGVTQATVSLALNKSPLISEETRTKVNEIAARLGYRRNPYISALVTSRRKASGKRTSSRKPVLAFCTNSDESETGERFTSFLPVVVDSAAHRASEKGYRLDRFGLSAEGMSGRRLMEVHAEHFRNPLVCGSGASHSGGGGLDPVLGRQSGLRNRRTRH